MNTKKTAHQGEEAKPLHSHGEHKQATPKQPMDDVLSAIEKWLDDEFKDVDAGMVEKRDAALSVNKNFSALCRNIVLRCAHEGMLSAIDAVDVDTMIEAARRAPMRRFPKT